MKRHSRLSLLLIVCLLLGQLGQLAHAYDVAAHDGGICDICLSSQTHDQTTVCPADGLSTPLAHERTPVPVPQLHLSTHFRYLSRAPPR